MTILIKQAPLSKYKTLEERTTLGGQTQIEAAAKTLHTLSGKIDTSKHGEPKFMMIITAISPYVYKREDEIYIVPVSCLGP